MGTPVFSIVIGGSVTTLEYRNQTGSVEGRHAGLRLAYSRPSDESSDMDFHELIRVRRSIRGYRPDTVEEDVLARVLGAARVAPSACNLQPFHIIVVTDAKTRARMSAVYSGAWLSAAPVLLVGCVEPERAWKRRDGWNAAEVDLAIAMDHVILAATQEGLGTCWVCAFDEAKAKEILGVPPGVRVVAMTPLGYPDGTPPQPSTRKSLADLVRRERW